VTSQPTIAVDRSTGPPQDSWLLINQGRHVWVRCLCGNQWLEPEITRADFDALPINPQWTNYPSVQQAMVDMGFDGAFAGIYLQ